MINGFRVTQLLHAAAELGICDAVAGGPRTATGIAAEVKGDPPLIDRLLRALVSQGILIQVPEDRYTNSPLGELMRADVPGSMRSFALAMPSRSSWNAWAELAHSIREGGIPYQLANGAAVWEDRARDPIAGDLFNRLMVVNTELFVPQLVAAFDFSACRLVVDVGGGNGALLAGILDSQPALQGIVFDLAQGLSGAESYLAHRGVRDRCELVAGDFFQAVPEGADLYLLRLILHDWDDDHARQILASCRAAMPAGGRLLIIDAVLPERPADSPADRRALMMDLHMHVLFGGRERTLADLSGMVQAVGLKVAKVLATTPAATIVCEGAA